ncbi:MAG: lipopolysaccharide assembly protein LapA domain-containing protein [Streptosporangiaceae bacterium]|jgi:uncharacterized integral membrane protein
MVAQQPQQPSQPTDSESPEQGGNPVAPETPETTAVPETAAPETVAPAPVTETRRSRISAAWTAGIIFTVVLLLLLIFILQNSRSVEISYLGAHGHLPLGVALLLAAVLGVLLIALPGGARILELRTAARRHRRADAASQAAQPSEPAAPTGT